MVVIEIYVFDHDYLISSVQKACLKAGSSHLERGRYFKEEPWNWFDSHSLVITYIRGKYISLHEGKKSKTTGRLKYESSFGTMPYTSVA